MIWLHLIIPIIICMKGVSLSKEMRVLQTPAELLRPLKDSVKLECTHKNPDFNTFLWYQRSKGETALKLIGYIYYKTQFIEPSFRGHFNVSVDRGNMVYLHIQSLKHPEHSAEYFAAARSFTEAYFGAGTKLTVLEPNLPPKQPTVKVLKPSVSECRNRKDNKQYNKTLVCVASDFYPDHVSVFWQIDGGNVTRGVATDSSARRDGKYYRITSRLMVPLTQWYTPEKNFSCTVSFFNGNKTTYSSNWVRGIEERYLRITHNAKLSYAVLIVKSSFFGVFVVVLLLCKLKGSSGKQND